MIDATLANLGTCHTTCFCCYLVSLWLVNTSFFSIYFTSGVWGDKLQLYIATSRNIWVLKPVYHATFTWRPPIPRPLVPLHIHHLTQTCPQPQGLLKSDCFFVPSYVQHFPPPHYANFVARNYRAIPNSPQVSLPSAPDHFCSDHFCPFHYCPFLYPSCPDPTTLASAPPPASSSAAHQLVPRPHRLRREEALQYSPLRRPHNRSPRRPPRPHFRPPFPNTMVPQHLPHSPPLQVRPRLPRRPSRLPPH